MARREDGTVAVDPVGGARGPGRGAYLCRNVSCVEQAFRSGGLRRTLRFAGEWPEELRSEILKTIEETDG
ncbi:MAG: YlxR family protein [Actinomycetota bacterium]|nr:YlxR family protein [Actinomycetota bacterium]